MMDYLTASSNPANSYSADHPPTLYDPRFQSMVSASFSGARIGTRKPVRCSSTRSSAPALGVTIIGRPQLSASIWTIARAFNPPRGRRSNCAAC